MGAIKTLSDAAWVDGAPVIKSNTRALGNQIDSDVTALQVGKSAVGHSHVKANITDLNLVDNTSDANKIVSGPQQAALNLKANLASPALTGTPTAPTAAAGTSTTQIATTAFVTGGITDKAAELGRELLADPAVSEVAALWSATVIGEPSGRAAIADADIRLATDGLVVRIAGAGTRAPRAAYRMVPGHSYEVLAVARRNNNPTDPMGDSVSLRAAWLAADKSELARADLEVFDLRTGSGLKIYRKIVSLASGDQIDVVAASNTIYFTPFVQVYGADGSTDIIPYVRVTDLTSSTLISADVTGLNARIAALESLDIGDRLDAIETTIAGFSFAYSYATPSTGNTVSASTGDAALIANPAADLAALTLELPPDAVDGQVFEFSTTKTIEALTVTDPDGGTVRGSGQTIGADSGFRWRFRGTGTTWFRVS